MSAAQPLSNMQQELLKLYASNIAEADQQWDEKGYTNETMESWLNEGNCSYSII